MTIDEYLAAVRAAGDDERDDVAERLAAELSEDDGALADMVIADFIGALEL